MISLARINVAFGMLLVRPAKKHKVSEPTIYGWRRHFGQMDAANVERLKALEPSPAKGPTSSGALRAVP